MRWSLVLDDEPTRLAVGDEEPEEGCPEGQVWDPDIGECVDEEAAVPGPPAEAEAGRFRALLIVEDTWSGDGRFIALDALTWRDLPLPLMGLDSTTDMHQEAVVIGSIDTITRQGNELWGAGPWAETAEANGIRQLVRDGHLRGVSADLDDVEFEIILPEPEEEGEEEGLLLAAAGDRGDGDVEGDVIVMEDIKMRVTSGRIMGATVVPFPAFSECFIEDSDPGAPLTASAVALTAAAVPIDPPRAWFDNPRFREHTPMTVTDSGRIYGHAADWESCHISFPDRCVPPPRSASNYAYFHDGEVRCSDGTRVAVGHLSVKGGHADLDCSGAQAKAYYDDTDACIADVCVGEDAYGIWMAGALRPRADPVDVRTAMASGVSGDWRRLGGNLELIQLSSVNVRGFLKPRTRVRESAGLVAAVIADMPPVTPDARLLDRAVDRLASTIGRSTAQRVEALYQRVHRPVA